MGHRSNITKRELECMLGDETAEPKALPLSLLEEITDGFSDQKQIGRGGFSVVYKGMLENSIVAVKRSTSYMHEKEFQREVACLMMVKHKHIIRFLGYCSDTQGTMAREKGKFIMADVQERLLCFEYLPKGSLHEYIADTSSRLQWRDVFQIIKGICHGLHFLHQINIVHLDLKPANILLDDNFVAKIADFGLSRFFDEQSRIITLNIGGTLGYLAPEFGNGEITYQFDIYSLGVIIIEILTGKKGYHDVEKVVERWNTSERSLRNINLEQVRVCAEIGIECTSFDPAKRPIMQHIIHRLDETENMERYIEAGVITARKEEVVFKVSKKPGYKIKQLRDLNNLHGSLVIHGLEKVTSKEEALEANLAAKKHLTKLELNCGSCDNADVLEGLCPPEGLMELHIKRYDGSRLPDWMVGKQNGGPKDLQELVFYYCENPTTTPKFVEAFPHLRSLKLWYCSWDALPGNMERLTSLKKLVIYGGKIRSLPTLPWSLEEFVLSSFDDEFIKSCKKDAHPNCQRIKHIRKKTIERISMMDRIADKLHASDDESDSSEDSE